MVSYATSSTWPLDGEISRRRSTMRAINRVMYQRQELGSKVTQAGLFSVQICFYRKKHVRKKDYVTGEGRLGDNNAKITLLEKNSAENHHVTFIVDKKIPTRTVTMVAPTVNVN